MGFCSAFGCTNRSNRRSNRRPKEGVTFHRFPRDKNTRKAWIEALKRQNFQPSKWSVLCSQHFQEKDLDRTSLSCVRVHEGAVPSIFPAFPTHLQKNLSQSCMVEGKEVETSGGPSGERNCAEAPVNDDVPEACTIIQAQNEIGDKVHFTEDQFEKQRKDNVRKLMPAAIPTILHLRRAPLKRRKPMKHLNKQNSAPSDMPKVLDHNYFNSGSIDELPVNKDSSEASLQEQPQEMHFDEILYTSSVPTMLFISEDITVLKRKLNLAENKIARLVKENNNLINRLSEIFNEDQLTFFKNGSTKVVWSDETVQKSLRMRLSCGSKGYNFLRDEGYPLPTEMTLQRRIQNFKLSPGINTEIVQLLHSKAKAMLTEERHAVLIIDEIAISEGLDFDVTEFAVGEPTLPSASGSLHKLATRALVFTLGGASTSWKQVLGYHFTGNSVCSKSLKQTVFEIIKQCESAGLIINGIVSDIGGQSQALWRECGIVAGKFTIVENHCPHPCDPERKLFFLLDTPHLLKSN